MDRERLEALEAHVISLVEAFARGKAENQQLSAENKRLSTENKRLQEQLQEARRTHQREMERLQPDREELVQLRTVKQTFQKERDLIRQKLQQMLSTLEWLEEHTNVDSGPKA